MKLREALRMLLDDEVEAASFGGGYIYLADLNSDAMVLHKSKKTITKEVKRYEILSLDGSEIRGCGLYPVKQFYVPEGCEQVELSGTYQVEVKPPVKRREEMSPDAVKNEYRCNADRDATCKSYPVKYYREWYEVPE